MKTINFINQGLSNDDSRNIDTETYEYLSSCWSRGFNYRQTALELGKKFNVYLPRDQYTAFFALCDAEVELESGCRQWEHRDGEEMDVSYFEDSLTKL